MPQRRYNLRPGAKGRRKATSTPESGRVRSDGSRSSPELQALKKVANRRTKKVRARKRAQSPPNGDDNVSPQEQQEVVPEASAESQPPVQEQEAQVGVVDRHASPDSPQGSYSPPSPAVRMMERYRNPPEGLDNVNDGAASVQSPGNDHVGLNEQFEEPDNRVSVRSPGSQVQEIAGNPVAPVQDGLPRGDLDAQWAALDQVAMNLNQNPEQHIAQVAPQLSPGQPVTAEDHAARGIPPEPENPYSPELVALLEIDPEDTQRLVAEAVAYHAARERQAREAHDPHRAQRDGWQGWWPQDDPLVRKWVGDQWEEMSEQQRAEFMQDLARSASPEARRRGMAADIQEAEELQRRQWDEEMANQLFEREGMEMADDGKPQLRVSLEHFTGAVAWEVAEKTRVHPAWATPDEVFRQDDASSDGSSIVS